MGTKFSLVSRIRWLLEKEETGKELQQVFLEKLKEGDPQFWRMAFEIYRKELTMAVNPGTGAIILTWAGDDLDVPPEIEAEWRAEGHLEGIPEATN